MNSALIRFQELLASADTQFSDMEQKLAIMEQVLGARITDVDEEIDHMARVIEASQLKLEETCSKVIVIE